MIARRCLMFVPVARLSRLHVLTMARLHTRMLMQTKEDVAKNASALRVSLPCSEKGARLFLCPLRLQMTVEGCAA